MISFTPELLHNFNSTTTREWLETNGIGGFACSTVIGLNARRYHALLTAAMRPPSGRVVLLSKMEETVVIGGVRYELSTNQYSGAVHPQDYWYKNFEYALERERELDSVEDLFNPLTFRFDMAGRDTATVIASTEILDVGSAGRLRDQESKRRSEVAARAPSEDELVRTLTAAADQYIVSRGDRKTIIAGYP